MNTDPKLIIEGQRKWFERIRHDSSQIHWIVYLDDMPIGLMQLMDIDLTNRRCSWGYYVAEIEKRSLKLAVSLEWNLYDYVFGRLKLHKLYNETFLENRQVVQLHLFCGSKQDGIMRHHIYKNGIYYDISVCSILAEEWEEKKRTISYEQYAFE